MKLRSVNGEMPDGEKRLSMTPKGLPASYESDSMMGEDNTDDVVRATHPGMIHDTRHAATRVAPSARDCDRPLPS